MVTRAAGFSRTAGGRRRSDHARRRGEADGRGQACPPAMDDVGATARRPAQSRAGLTSPQIIVIPAQKNIRATNREDAVRGNPVDAIMSIVFSIPILIPLGGIPPVSSQRPQNTTRDGYFIED